MPVDRFASGISPRLRSQGSVLSSDRDTRPSGETGNRSRGATLVPGQCPDHFVDLRVVSSQLRRYAPCILQTGDSLLTVAVQQPATRHIDVVMADPGGRSAGR